MRIVLNDYAGHPFQLQLSRFFASHGDEVLHIYCDTNITPRGDTSTSSARLQMGPLSTGKSFNKYSVWRRVLAEFRYGVASSIRHRQFSPDVVVLSNVPILALLIVSVFGRNRHQVLWLQDIQSGLVKIASGGRRTPLVRTSRQLERLGILCSRSVIAISEELKEEAVRLGAPESRIEVVENWAPLDEIVERPKVNDWSLKHGLTDKFVFLYSGTLGIKHDPSILWDLAVLFEGDADVRVVVASEGKGAEWLARRKTLEGQPNLILLPFLDYQDLADAYGSSDTLIVLLDPEAGGYSVPSKTLAYLCAGRPILGFLPATNLAARTIARARAGLSVGTKAEFYSAASTIRADPEYRATCGRNAREFAEASFGISEKARLVRSHILMHAGVS